MSKSLSKVSWEVWVEFDWGVISKNSYENRENARKGMKYSKDTHLRKDGTNKPYSYIKKISLKKVTFLAGLSALNSQGVYVVEDSR